MRLSKAIVHKGRYVYKDRQQISYVDKHAADIDTYLHSYRNTIFQSMDLPAEGPAVKCSGSCLGGPV